MTSLISVVCIIPSPSLILINNITIITILSVNYHRHLYLITSYSTLCSINLFVLNRNVVRLVHIPFSKIRINREEHRVNLEDDHKIACDLASSSIGLFIAIGSVLESHEFNESFHARFLPIVREVMTDLPNRTHRSYALVLAVTNEVSFILSCEIEQL